MQHFAKIGESAMSQHAETASITRARALRALSVALRQARPEVTLDAKGYAQDFTDVLVPMAEPAAFEEDLRAGAGNELNSKFRAAHSSSALVVNCFAPFVNRPGDLRLPGLGTCSGLRFEQQCPVGLRGKAPHLDVLAGGSGGIVGVESKLCEYLSPHSAYFSPSYNEQIRDERRDQGWFREMLRLMEEPDDYQWLDAAQLIKHAYGLGHAFAEHETTLLYLYWEPLGAEEDETGVFAEHRAEIARFADRITGAGPQFVAASYFDLWEVWRSRAPDWLIQHLDAIEARYKLAL